MKYLAALLLLFLTSDIFAQNSILANLHPRPQAGFTYSGAPFRFDANAAIVIEDNPSDSVLLAADYFVQRARRWFGITLSIVRQSAYTGGDAIFIGLFHEPAIAAKVAAARPSRERDSAGARLPAAQGYILDINEHEALIAANETKGLMNGVATWMELAKIQSMRLQPMHIWDAPDYPIRWAYLPLNMQVQTNVQVLRSLEDTLAQLKLNGVLHADFKYNRLNDVPAWYFSNIDSMKEISKARGIEIIPAVADIGYSEGLLLHDPNLAEGVQSHGRYVMGNTTAQLLPDTSVALPNGNFESTDNGKFTGWTFYDGPSVSSFVDKTDFHSGQSSARCTDFTKANPDGNCRFSRFMTTQKFKAYHMSVWIKTAGFKGTFQLLAIGYDGSKINRTLTSTQFSAPTNSQGWQKYDVVFNSLNSVTMRLYCGVWGGSAGTIWFDDFAIEELGLVNVLRRPGTPFEVRFANTGTLLPEGGEYERVVDSVMLKNNGSYPLHAPVTIRRTPNALLKSRDTIDVTYYTPIPTIQYGNGDGQTNVCISEVKTDSLLREQALRVNVLLNPRRWFLSYDEIRVMNWDPVCTDRGLSPAEELAASVNSVSKMIDGIHRGAEFFVWSDMFDPLHNALVNYYLVNGSLQGSAPSLPAGITIANWNYGSRTQSLAYFAGLGMLQITCPYYDSRSTASMREWRVSMEDMNGVRGMMYTTWQSDYSYLTPFASYVWGAGPAIYHAPPDTAAWLMLQGGNGITIKADVFPDSYDASDAITSVRLNGDTKTGSISIPMTGSGTSFSAVVNNAGLISYSIEARNSQGLRRTTPVYSAPTVLAVPENDEVHGLQVTVENGTLRVSSADKILDITIYDIAGRLMMRQEAASLSTSLSLQGLAAGAYGVSVACSGQTLMRMVVVR